VNDRERQIDTYIDTWNESDVDKRYALIEQAWSHDGVYHAPAVEVRGHEEISDNIARVRRRYPTRVFCRTGEVFLHRNRARYTWAMLDLSGKATIAGVDYALFAEDGRLRRVHCVHSRKPRADELGPRPIG
jgi:hypothetical protein